MMEIQILAEGIFLILHRYMVVMCTCTYYMHTYTHLLVIGLPRVIYMLFQQVLYAVGQV